MCRFLLYNEQIWVFLVFVSNDISHANQESTRLGGSNKVFISYLWLYVILYVSEHLYKYKCVIRVVYTEVQKGYQI